MMSVVTDTVIIWVILAIGFLVSLLRDDGALSLLTGALMMFLGVLVLFYFAVGVSEKMSHDVGIFLPSHDFSGTRVDYLGYSVAWGPAIGWFLMLAALALATVGTLIRVYAYDPE
jgi:hypothetical protein